MLKASEAKTNQLNFSEKTPFKDLFFKEIHLGDKVAVRIDKDTKNLTNSEYLFGEIIFDKQFIVKISVEEKYFYTHIDGECLEVITEDNLAYYKSIRTASKAHFIN